MEIITYTKRQLLDAIYNNAWIDESHVPITRHKALLLINNPRTENDDVLLLVSKEKDKVIGYRAMSPDFIYADNDKHKIGWGSCYWVDSDFRGKGVGYKLLDKSYDLYSGSIGSLSQSEMAANVYVKSGKFFEYQKTIGNQLIIRFNFSYWFNKKFPNYRTSIFILRGLDSLLNYGYKFRLLTWKKRNHPKDLLFEYSAELFDKQADDLIQKLNKNDLTRKNAQDINNIVKNYTSLSTPFPDHTKERYFFDTKEDRFFYCCLKVLDKNKKIIGIIVFNINGDELTTPYIFSEKSDCETVARVICLHLIRFKAKIYKSYDANIIQHIKTLKFPILFDKQIVRKSYLPNKFKGMKIHDKKIHDGDGA